MKAMILIPKTEEGKIIVEEYIIRNVIEDDIYNIEHGDYFLIKGMGKLLIKEIWIGGEYIGFQCRKTGVLC